IYNKKNGIAKLKIKSAFPIDSQLVDKIAATFKLKKYELETEIDKNLIGGFVAKYGDSLIDASIKHQLKCLHSKLIN
ncbi:F0F1 ATP synthase subunit delta, partial [Patescibacteria group bacterium]|nr:F0F1 ATP synthase subunit delta [Patescibacteria group bacterium]